MIIFLLIFSGNVSINDENFDRIILEEKSKPIFVKLWALWCIHCQKMADQWDLFEKQNANNNNFIIADLECSQYNNLCKKVYPQKGESYPRLFWIDNKNNLKILYEGARYADEFQKFVNKQLHFPVIPSEQADLENYTKHNKLSVVVFYVSQSIDENELNNVLIPKIKEVANKFRAVSINFLLIRSYDQTYISIYSGSKIFNFDKKDWSIGEVVEFVKSHHLVYLSPYASHAELSAHVFDIPLFLIIQKTEQTLSAKSVVISEQFSQNFNVLTANCQNDTWLCKYMRINPTYEEDSYVLFYGKKNLYYIVDENITYSEWIKLYKYRKIRWDGPGDGILGFIYRPFYDARLNDMSPPYILFTIPFMIVFLCYFIVSDFIDCYTTDKSKKKK